MGWQIFPTGIGWRAFGATITERTIACPSDRCSGRQSTARHRSDRNWITVLYIPVIPLNRTGEYLQCRTCKTILPVTFLETAETAAGAGNTPTGNAATERSGTGTLVYDMGNWTGDHRSTILDELQEHALELEVVGTDLRIDQAHEELVDQVIANSRGTRPPPATDGTEVR